MNSMRRVAPAGTLLAVSSLAAYLVHSRRTEGETVSSPLATSTSVQDDKAKLIFLGTGSSTGCPKPLCTMVFQQPKDKLNEEQRALRESLEPRCIVSNLAIQGDPRLNKDYRNNPSFLIHHFENGKPKNIIIDVGKTFREGALRWFPQLGIYSLDAIVLTHHHMDAVAGLDDVRGFQMVKSLQPSDPPIRVSVPVYLSEFCYNDLSDRFPWLLPRPDKPYKVDDSKPVVHRDVASFQVKLFEDYRPFRTQGIDIIPLPVWHGDDLISHGFAFTIQSKSGTQRKNVVYLSDISRMVPETLEFIQKLPPTDVLVLDALLWNGENPVHFSLEQAMELRDKIRPKGTTYLVGMNCDSFLPHEEMNQVLKKKYGDVQLAHDGLAIEIE